jgi:hypothetical protein
VEIRHLNNKLRQYNSCKSAHAVFAVSARVEGGGNKRGFNNDKYTTIKKIKGNIKKCRSKIGLANVGDAREWNAPQKDVFESLIFTLRQRVAKKVGMMK